MNIKFIIAIFVSVALFSCEEKQWDTSDLELVPVFTVTNMDTEAQPYALEIYREKPLLIEYENVLLLNAYTSYEYAENTVDTFSVSCCILDEVDKFYYTVDSLFLDAKDAVQYPDSTIIDTTITFKRYYTVEADVLGDGYLNVADIYDSRDTLDFTTHLVTVKAEEVYN